MLSRHREAAKVSLQSLRGGQGLWQVSVGHTALEGEGKGHCRRGCAEEAVLLSPRAVLHADLMDVVSLDMSTPHHSAWW